MSRKIINIYTGQPFGGQKQPEVVIKMIAPFPDFKGDDLIEQSEFQHNKDAELLEETLIQNLPGGTYDRLLGLMLKRKSTHFIVSHKDRIK